MSSPPASGWQAHLTVEEEEQAEAVVYCPACAEREFGEASIYPPDP